MGENSFIISKTELFNGRRLVIATKHEKEKVIGPILEKELGVSCFITPELDTDLLGTFTGEIARKLDVISTLRAKCQQAMELSGCDLAVASEGSFGMHPNIFFAPADDELIMFMDKKNELEIIVRELSTDTNFNSAQVSSKKELLNFANSAGFPSHGLILRRTSSDAIACVKGITNWDDLHATFDKFLKDYGFVYIETDMRALYNPLRMKVIDKAAKKLSEKVNCLCPTCEAPGFGVTDSKQGLPCENCYSPTRSTLSHTYSCVKCLFTQESFFPNSKLKEAPMYCDVCNP